MTIDLQDKFIILLQADQRTIPEWIEYFDNKYSKAKISNLIYHNNLRPKKLDKESKNSRKWNINQDYFKIWSRNMAYVLGFWFADGCIYRNQMFDITLHKKDKYILKQIAKELGYEGPIQDYVDRQVVRLNFSCVVIYNDIVSLGGTEQKEFPHVPKEFLPDFIRGYFDGNGSVYNVQGGRINTAFCSGSKKFLMKLLEILYEEAGLKGGSYDKNNMKIVFGNRDSYLLRNYIYANEPSLFLLRKKKKFFKEET